MAREPDETNPANPRTPNGGTAMLVLVIFLIVVAGLLAWGFLRTGSGAPKPTASGTPAAMPAGSSGH